MVELDFDGEEADGVLAAARLGVEGAALCLPVPITTNSTTDPAPLISDPI